MSNPILSIGIIFKNDIRCLERCLKSLEPLRQALPCQLVMADTGSTDGSRAVAEQYADILFDFPWIDDFAAARNAVLDRCTGEWYLTIDSDEWLDPEFQELLEFLNSKDRNRYDLASLIQRNYQDEQLHDYGDFFAARLGRRRGGKLRYAGAIHEVLVFTDRPAKSNRAFPRVILHHDGYVNVTPKHLEEKKKRNMELLRTELEKNPHDIRILLHCMDSAEGEEEEQYVEQAEALLKKGVKEQPVFCMIAYQKCMQTHYMHHRMDRALQCYEAWKAYSPQSALLRLDGEGMAAIASFDREEYASALEHIQKYHLAVQEKENGNDLQCLDRLYAQYNTDNFRWRSNLKSIEFQCLCRLERFEDADRLLRDTSLEELRVVDRGNMVLELLKQPERLTESGTFLRRCWDFHQDEAAWEPSGESEIRLQALEDFKRMLLNYLNRVGAKGWQLLAQMGDCAPGISARIMLSNDAETIAQAWEGVTQWKEIFPQAYLHTLEHCAPFPQSFYDQGEEFLRGIAALLGKEPTAREQLPLWAVCDPDPTDLVHRQFLFQCTIAALRSTDWATEDAKGLVELWLHQAGGYLSALYHPQVLAQERKWTALPGLHRCTLHVLQAYQAGEQGDELDYVRGLRAALDVAPVMKGAVEYLLAHPPKSEAQRQLEQLAQQVRTVLAQYAPDDPAVVALKASPAYQRVSHLLLQ